MVPPIEPVLLDRFEYRGLNGRPAWCRLELIPLSGGRTVAIATEMIDNPGTSITNAAEYLASFVCDCFEIDPDKLVWIEHYGYGGRHDRTYDLVTFRRRPTEMIRWAKAVLRYHASGWPGHFEEPQWRPMCDEDWRDLGLPPRQPMRY
jgi:hypothetical protein